MSFTDNKNQTSQIRTMRGDLEALKNGGSVEMEAPLEEQYSSVPSTASHPIDVHSNNPFQKEIEEISSTTTSTISSQVPPVDSIPQQVPQQAPEQVNPVPVNQEQNNQNIVPPYNPSMVTDTKNRNLLVIIGGVLILLCLGGVAGYYFLVVKKPASGPIVPIVDVKENTTPSENNKEKNSPVASMYSLDKANYLSFNVETVSKKEIKENLRSIHQYMLSASLNQPLEFLITDQNNNRVAFSRFALLLKFSIPQEILSLIEEPFSLYVYNDAGAPRIGFDLLLKDQTSFSQLLGKNEDRIPESLQTAFFDFDTAVPQSIPFKSNVYTPHSSTNTTPIAVRYANVDSAKNLSIDYALVNNHMYIGTSKNTLTAILDKNIK